MMSLAFGFYTHFAAISRAKSVSLSLWCGWTISHNYAKLMCIIGTCSEVELPRFDWFHSQMNLFIFVWFTTGEITLIATGPLTNIALALRLDPKFGTKLKQCIIMGGNTKGRQMFPTNNIFTM